MDMDYPGELAVCVTPACIPQTHATLYPYLSFAVLLTVFSWLTWLLSRTGASLSSLSLSFMGLFLYRCF